MTIDELRSYRRICAELADVEAQLAECEVTDCVQSAARFPYSVRSVPVSGLPSGGRVISLLEKRAELRARKGRVERFVNSQDDGTNTGRVMKYILTQKYFCGRSNLYIAMKLGYRDETVVRRKIKNFFQKAEKAEFDVI